MTLLNLTLAVSTLVAMSAVVTTAQECTPDVSDAFVATITNSSYFNTCAEGTTFNITSVLEAANFTAPNLLAFCGSEECLEPIHELMAPLSCNITYLGTLRNLSSEVATLHDLCHETLDEADAGSHAMGDPTMHMDGQNNTQTASGVSSIVLTTGSVVFATLLAAILA